MFTESDLSDHSAHESDGTPIGERFAAGYTSDAHDESPHEASDGLIDHHFESTDEHLSAATDDVAAGTGDADSGTDLVSVSTDGTQIDLGGPNLSYGGHGLDSVGVEHTDGSLEVYTDVDHDGDVDQAVRIDADGSFTAWTADGDGHWTAYATGHVDSTGHAVVDHAVDPTAVDSAPSIAGGPDPVVPPVDHVDPNDPGSGTRTYPGVAAGDLAVAADGHYIDAGPATYDLDGDGHPETAVVQSDGRVIQVSDTNGDGRADEMLQVDSATHQAAILTDDGTGHWQVAATGHISADGQFVEEHSAGVVGSSAPVDPAPLDPAPLDPAPLDPAPAHAAPVDPAPAHAAPTQAAPADPAPAGEPTAEGVTHPPDIVYTSPTGVQTDLGAPNRDFDGDGVPESVAVRTEEGDVLVLSDTNADGRPDQLIQVDSRSGDATWAVPDGHGGWEVVQTGHVEADGTMVVDHTEQTAQPVPQHPARDEQPAPGQPPHEQAPQTGAPPAHPDEHIEVDVSGRSFDAGPATIDTDGDGVPDTVAVTGPGGSTLFYQDTNGDGVADKAWTTDSGGQVTANYALESGNWVAVAAAGRSS